MDLAKELYQIIFIMSATYFGIVGGLFLFRVIRSIIFDVNTTMKFNLIDKILLLITFSIIIAYLI